MGLAEVRPVILQARDSWYGRLNASQSIVLRDFVTYLLAALARSECKRYPNGRAEIFHKDEIPNEPQPLLGQMWTGGSPNRRLVWIPCGCADCAQSEIGRAGG